MSIQFIGAAKQGMNTCAKCIRVSAFALLIVSSGCGGHGSSGPSNQATTQDTVAPVIQLQGENPQNLMLGETYYELGATATDDVDGDISNRIQIDSSSVDVDTVGSYIVTYDVTDSSGNSATQVRRSVNVNPPVTPRDTVLPVIELIGENPQGLELGELYEELGATATDDVDGNISDRIQIDASQVDTSTVGSYVVTYDVTDSSGNAAVQARRVVTVVPPLASNSSPSVTILEPADNIQVKIGADLTFSAIADDEEDGDVSETTVWTSNLENSTVIGVGSTISISSLALGSHIITATATDSAGWTGSASIAVEVVGATDVANLPNVLLFLSDDVGWGDTGAYNSESKIPTPNIDTLAAEGMMFTDAHTPFARCAPTRYAVMTGNYQWRGRKGNGVWDYKGGSQVLPGQITLGQMMQRAGYDTAFIGKVHLGGDFYLKGSDRLATYSDDDTVIDFSRGIVYGPPDMGFDYTYTLLRGIQNSPFAFFRNRELDGQPEEMVLWEVGSYDGSKINHAGIGVPDWDSREAGQKLVSDAVDFIDQHQARISNSPNPSPFFLYYSSQSAHAPFTPPETLMGEPVDNVPTVVSNHADMIYEVDVALGVLIDTLKKHGILDSTLIIFTSDNGGNPESHERDQGHDSVAGLRGRKSYVWEGGHRVPFIVRWGDGTTRGSQVPPGTVRSQLVAVHDIYATLAAIVGADLSDGQGVDSFNLEPVILGNRNDSAPIREHMIQQGVKIEEKWGYREGSWKLILDSKNRALHLFDLSKDIGESNDLVNDPQHAIRIAEMQENFIRTRSADRTAP